jgi:hypothetical protein
MLIYSQLQHTVYVFIERSMSYSDESRLSNLLRRITREDDRDRRLATVKQLKEFIQQPENKLVRIVGFEYSQLFLCFHTIQDNAILSVLRREKEFGRQS